MQAWVVITAAALPGILCGCASTSPDTEIAIPVGGYARAFDDAKRVLREFEFELDRVDARRGVISTAPRGWSGAATPWLPYASSPLDPIEGLVQFEQRVVRVEFARADLATGESAGDLVESDKELVARVKVIVQRIQRPGRRVDASSVRLSGFQRDLLSSDPEPGGAIILDHREDPALAARLAAEWRGLQPSAAPATP